MQTAQDHSLERHFEDDPPDLLAGLRNGAWLDAQDFPPLRYAVPGIIPEGSTLLVGPPKIGKSWLVLAVGLGVAHGGHVLGAVAVESRPALYLALEDGDRRLQDRCRTLLEGAPIPEAFDYMTTIEPGAALATIQAWLRRHIGAEPLVILDTLGKVMPPALLGESSYQRDYRVGGALKRVIDEHPGASLVVNHHDRKAVSDDFIDAVSGTHGLAGAADTIIVLTRARHEAAGLLKVTGRDVAEGEYAVRFDAGARWQLEGPSLAAAAAKAAQARATAGLGDRTAEILEYVNEHPDGVQAKDVEEEFGKDTRRYLARLHEAGKIARPSRGLYGPLSPLSQCPNDEAEPDGRCGREGHGWHLDGNCPDDALGQRDGWDSPTGEPQVAYGTGAGHG